MPNLHQTMLYQPSYTSINQNQIPHLVQRMLMLYGNPLTYTVDERPELNQNVNRL
jgi:hypothetical protein